MKSYLGESELPLYTDKLITMLDAENATLAIDAYKGMSFFGKKYVEQSKLNKKTTGCGCIYKGRLKHTPRLDILGVKAFVPMPFGMQVYDFGADSIIFDDDESAYFTFYPQGNPVFNVPTPQSVLVTYMAGYDTIPEEIKRVTAQLASNLSASGNGLKWTSREDFDLKITLTKDGVFTNEIKKIIDRVVLS